MIRNDLELQAMQERIAYFERILMQLRVSASAQEFPLVSSSYRMELERMHGEVLDYLSRHSSVSVPAGAV